MQQPQQARNAWRVLFLLFLANMFNFFDRTIPAIIIEPLRMEWDLSDFQLGLGGTAFTVIYALAGIQLGRMADVGSRRKIMGWGLAVWSGFTALTGAAWNFWSFLIIRMGVGVGEASYAPAANSLIGDLFPAHKRARAMGIFMLGLPLGLLLAFFTVGAMVEAFDSWRAPFYIAAVPVPCAGGLRVHDQGACPWRCRGGQDQRGTGRQADAQDIRGAYLLVADAGRAGLQLCILRLQLVHGADAATVLSPVVAAGRGVHRHHRGCDGLDRSGHRRLDCRQGSSALGNRATDVRRDQHADLSALANRLCVAAG